MAAPGSAGDRLCAVWTNLVWFALEPPPIVSQIMDLVHHASVGGHIYPPPSFPLYTVRIFFKSFKRCEAMAISLWHLLLVNTDLLALLHPEAPQLAL